MLSKLKLFVPIFLIVGLFVFGFFYYDSGNIGNSILMGVIGGTVVGLILTFALPFIKKEKH